MIILLGATGYIGQQFVYELTHRQIDFLPVTRNYIDYTNPQILEKFLIEKKPEFVINCAGYTGKPNVDACEVNQESCFLGNVFLPMTVDNVCRSLGIPWGHVSSGCIYSGTREDGSGFTELDEPNFCFDSRICSFYSGTKALGERMIKNSNNSYIWRLRIPFDENNNPRNYLTKIQSYEKVFQATNSISHRGDFVSACLDLYLTKAAYGVYNVVNTGYVTTEQVVNLTKKILKLDKKFEYWESDEEFYKFAAKAPRSNCILDNSKLIAAGIKIRSVEDALVDALVNWRF